MRFHVASTVHSLQFPGTVSRKNFRTAALNSVKLARQAIRHRTIPHQLS